VSSSFGWGLKEGWGGAWTTGNPESRGNEGRPSLSNGRESLILDRRLEAKDGTFDLGRGKGKLCLKSKTKRSSLGVL